jgi:hypothetical protein
MRKRVGRARWAKRSFKTDDMKRFVASVPREPLSFLMRLGKEFATFHRVTCRIVLHADKELIVCQRCYLQEQSPKLL